MSVAIREFVEDVYAAWNRDDLEGFVGFTAPDVVVRPSGAFPDLPVEYNGHEGVRGFWHDVRGPWRELTVEVEAVEAHSDIVFVSLRFSARGRDDVAVDARFFQVGELHDGLARRIEAYVDEGKARERLHEWAAGSR